MDAVAFAKAAKQEQRLKKIIANPDSNSGVITTPQVIATGETITIPAGRTAVLPNLQVNGEFDVQGEVFIPSGGTIGLDTINVSVIKQDGLDVANAATTVAKDSDTGAAMIPSGTTAQRPVSPMNGYIRYNTELLSMEAYTNGAWGGVGGGATGGGTDNMFTLNGQTITADYTIPTGQNAMTVGDITIATGVTVTVPTGSKWVIL